MIEIFSKEYDSESVCDVQRDVLEAFDVRFNDSLEDIPRCGKFSVIISWHPENEERIG